MMICHRSNIIFLFGDTEEDDGGNPKSSDIFDLHWQSVGRKAVDTRHGRYLTFDVISFFYEKRIDKVSHLNPCFPYQAP
jgi:hypothetical protein